MYSCADSPIIRVKKYVTLYFPTFYSALAGRHNGPTVSNNTNTNRLKKALEGFFLYPLPNLTVNLHADQASDDGFDGWFHKFAFLSNHNL